MSGRRLCEDTAALAWLQAEADRNPAAVPTQHKKAVKRLARTGRAVARLVAEPTDLEVRELGIEAWGPGYSGNTRARLYACTPLRGDEDARGDDLESAAAQGED